MVLNYVRAEGLKLSSARRVFGALREISLIRLFLLWGRQLVLAYRS